MESSVLTKQKKALGVAGEGGWAPNVPNVKNLLVNIFKRYLKSDKL